MNPEGVDFRKLFLTVALFVLTCLLSPAVAQNPIASFTVDRTTGCIPLTVTFTNTSQNAVSWYWDFGNGNYSTSQHPVNVYHNTGAFTVKLVAYNATGQADSIILQGYIQPVVPPAIDFSASTNIQCLGSGSINFTNQSQNFSSCLWDFGDGNTSTALNPQHQYTAPGFYTVTLIGYNTALGCTSSLSKNALITVLSTPIATFTANQTSTCDAQAPIQFTSTPSSAIQWHWDFGDGTTAVLQNPSHTYNVPGVYDVTLITTNQLGCTDTALMQGYIQILSNPVPVINSTNPLTACAPLQTLFSTSVTNVSNYLWDLGNGIQSSGSSYGYNNYQAGNHIISLTVVYNNGCINEDTVHVHVNANYAPLGGATVSAGCNPLSVPFYNNTAGSGNTYLWDFGDGNTSTQATPVHIYNQSGQYNVSLTVISQDGCANTNQVGSINVSQPSAQFTVDRLSGCPPLQVNFSSAGAINLNYQWDFGDSQTSNVPSPSHSYQSPGTYQVTLTVTDPSGCSNTWLLPSQIQVSNGVNNFSPAPPVIACAPFSVNFSDNSPGAINWNWDFGDGYSSSQQNPVHTYTAAGTYQVGLQTQSGGNGCSQNVFPYATYIIKGGEADFTSTQTICPPYTSTFTDLSVNAVSWLWEFGDGSTSTLQNPVHIYPQPGNYNVSLTITTADGCVYTKFQNWAASFLPLVANATATTNDTIPPLNVQFNANSSGATQWFWDFGDGGTSTQQNPLHVFTTGGPFNISLTISNPGCSFTYYYNSVTLGSGGALPGPGNDSTIVPPPLYSCIPYQMNFADPSANAVTWLWLFGDGDSSTQQNPVHIYTDPGVYYVTLITWDSLGVADTIEQTAPYYLTGSTSDFTITNANTCSGSVLQTHNHSVNAVSYLWDFGDGTTSTLFEPTHTYNTTGVNYIISLRVTDSLGCTDFMAQSYYAASNMPMSVSALKGCIGDTISFNSGGLNFYSYLWDFGDGNVSSAANPVYVYPDSGVYQVSLTVTDSSGCTNTWTMPYLIRIYKPVAGFTYVVSPNGCFAPSIQFTNTSTGASAYLWDFGNGITSTQLNPNQIFNTPGLHSVTLIASNEGCQNSYSFPNIVNYAPLSANFGYTQSTDCYPITVVLSDSSTNAVSWLWNFGDGTTSNLQNPVHTFTSKPFGPITLAVTSATGCVKYISLPNIQAMEVNLVLSDSIGCTPFNISFVDSSIGATSYSWDFGDGTVSSLPSPSHLYTQNGNYQINLTVTSSSGCQQVMPPVVINASGPQANFVQNTIVSCAPTIVSFTDLSQGAHLWNWDFGNGNHSILSNPTHIYNQPGNYDITLIVADSSGCTDTLIMPDLVHITGSVAAFNIQSTTGCSPWEVQFSDSSISAFSWVWNFGDGNTSTQQNPLHIYQTPGSYQVTLTTLDTTGCQSVYTNPLPLQVNQPPQALFTSSSSTGCAPSGISFNNTSTGSVNYQWYFGDGGSSTLASPNHQYTSAGIYYPILVATNAAGCTDTLISNLPLTIVEAPVATFMVANNSGCSPLPVNFINQTTNTDSTTTYNWSFGNGQTSNQSNPVFTFQQPGVYSVTLTATNGQNCTSSYTLPQAVVVQNGNPLPAVELKSVSVVGSQSVEITWENLPSQNLLAYNIYKLNQSDAQYYLLHTDSNPGNTSMNLTSLYTDTLVNTSDSIYTYKVQAVNTCNVVTPLSIINPHSSINLRTSLNGNYAKLEWNLYNGCSVQDYEILRQDHAAAPFATIATVSNATNTFTDSSVYCNIDVRYLIRAINLCGEGYEAFSDVEMISMPGTISQQKVDMVRSTVVDDAWVYTEWAAPNLAPQLVTGYELYRSTDNVNFILIDSLMPGDISYSDYDVNVKAQNYYYRIRVNNVCNIETTQGLESSSILLTGGHDSIGNTLLRWTPYTNWETGVDYYVIERQDDSGTWQTIRVVNGNVLEITDH